MAGKKTAFFLLLVFAAAAAFGGCMYPETENTGIYYSAAMEPVTKQAETAAAAVTQENRSLEEEQKETEEGITGTKDKEKTNVRTESELAAVYVCGAVKVPGVYYLPANARAYQAVEAAGGFTEEARQEAVNLADYIQDGQQIYIPKTEEQGWEAFASENTAASEAVLKTEDEPKISVNRASKEELMQLPGIGEAKAEAIIAYREEHGAFASKEDIMLVSGIKEAAYLKLKDKITVD